MASPPKNAENPKLTETTEDITEEVLHKPGDIQIEEIVSEVEDEESSPAQYEISTYPADFTLEGLHQKWTAGEIEIPKFQRQFVWKQVQASKLIESFFLGLPVPAVFLYTERKSQKYLVIDGQQRLKTVFYFFEGFFGEEVKGKRQLFRLKGLNELSPLNGKLFTDLEEEEQRRLRNCVLRSFIVKQLDPNDDTSIYHIFERLNTGGTLLTAPEVRNCVYHGPLNDLLVELNKTPEWRRILGKPGPDSRQKDIQLILRFLALEDPSKYEKPLKDFLSKFMHRNRFLPKDTLETFKKLFLDTVKRVLEALGETPFHIRAGLNSAVFDSVMVAFAKHPNANLTGIKQRFHELIANDEFLETVRASTTDTETVRRRFALAENSLFPNS